MSEIKNKKLLILGAGGHGKVCADCAALTGSYSEIAFLDDNLVGQKVLGYEVLGGFADLESRSSEYNEAFIALGNNVYRGNWLHKLHEINMKAAQLIHPDSSVSNHAEIGPGCVVLAGAVVNADAVLKEGVIVNTRAVIEHDCFIEKCVHVSPGAVIAGGTHIGENTWVCMGSKISNNITIGSNSVIAADSTLLKDIGDNVMVAGTPAVIKKELK